MSSSPPPIIRPADYPGAWLVDDHRYYKNAHVLLAELEVVVVEVQSQWAKPITEAVKQEETSVAHWNLARKRDLLSDAVKVFSAMSVEAFLNFYGVVRLGQAFDSKFERLGPVKKLKRLFELCENVILTDTDPLVAVVDRIAKRRNRLVHPRVTEVAAESVGPDRDGDKIPEVAREAVADMIVFFEEFGNREPNIAHHLPSSFEGNA